jgi:hypothetical protein
MWLDLLLYTSTFVGFVAPSAALMTGLYYCSKESSPEEEPSKVEILRESCQELLSGFRLDPATQKDISSLINEVFSSVSVKNILEEKPNPSLIASTMLAASSSVFTEAERDYITKTLPAFLFMQKKQA